MSELVNKMVAAFDEYGDEYTIEQAMQHVADVCQKHFMDTIDKYMAATEKDIRADERQHFVEQACAAIADNPHKNPIEAITDMIRKESQSPP